MSCVRPTEKCRFMVKGCVKSRTFLLRRRARFPSPSEQRATTHVPTNLHRSVEVAVFAMSCLMRHLRAELCAYLGNAGQPPSFLFITGRPPPSLVSYSLVPPYTALASVKLVHCYTKHCVPVTCHNCAVSDERESLFSPLQSALQPYLHRKSSAAEAHAFSLYGHFPTIDASDGTKNSSFYRPWKRLLPWHCTSLQLPLPYHLPMDLSA